MRDVFVHLHIPKCGGTAVHSYLAAVFGHGLFTTNSILNDYQYDATQVLKIIRQFPLLRCLTGHKLSLDLPFAESDLHVVAFTWIRDPVERFVSHYYYHLNHTELVPQAKSMDFETYLEWAIIKGNQPMYQNGQVRFLSGGRLDRIQEAVAAKRLLLFPLERMNASIATLENDYPDVFRAMPVILKNESKKDVALPDNYRERILPYVADDLKLLDMARQTHLIEGEAEIVGDLCPESGFPGSLHGRLLQRSANLLRHVARNLDRMACT